VLDLYGANYRADFVIFKVKNNTIMKANMGKQDRIIRIIAALAIGALYYFGVIGGMVATILGVVAVVFVLTSFFSFCPLYLPFNLSTRNK